MMDIDQHPGDRSASATNNPDGPRVAVLGASLDVGNRGVRALGVSVARLIHLVKPAAKIVFHYGNVAGGVRRLEGRTGVVEVEVRNCRMSLRSRAHEHLLVILGLAVLHRLGIRGPARRNAWLRSLLESALIGEIRGGDSFSDIYGLRRFVEGSLPLLSVAMLNRPYVMLPQTYGPFRSRVSRAIARVLLLRARALLTRDRNCEDVVRQLCGRTPDFCPDVAFTLEAEEPADLGLRPLGLSLSEPQVVIGVNVSGLLYMGGYTGRNMFGLRSDYRKLVDELIDRVLGSTSAHVLLIPHVFGSEQEEEACSALLASAGRKYPGRVFAITKPLSEREIKWVIGRTHLFIGSRMHGCIAALSQHVPAVGLAYSDKFLGVFESAGVGDAIVDLRKVDTDTVIRQTLWAIEHRAEIANNLRARMPAVQKQVVDTFRGLLEA